MATTSIAIEFSGGAELLVKGVKRHAASIPTGFTLRDLIAWIRDNLLTERPELFVQNDTVFGPCRPGILVLVNDTDWELLDELNYKLVEGDTVVFISTLHGG